MYIKPSTEIRNNYNKISALCKETREPIYLTKNGEGDLVVLDIDTFETMQAAIQLQENLNQVEMMREQGVEDIPASEVLQNMRAAIQGVASHV